MVYKALESRLAAQGYRITSHYFQSPLKALHPELGELEIHFYGENLKINEETFTPFPIYKRTRGETLNIWRTERAMMDEEAAHNCTAKAICLALSRLATRKDNTRIGLAFPEAHNFMKHLGPLVPPLAAAGIDFFFICSDLSVLAVGKHWDLLPAHESGLLIDQNAE